VTRSADDLVDRARLHISRTAPADLAATRAAGGLIVDIRPVAQRAEEGELPGALVVERNVLEWRLDPNGSHRLPEATGFDRPVVLVCSQGYASSLAAYSLRKMGYEQVGDLIGGYLAWREWVTDQGDRGDPGDPGDGAAVAGLAGEATGAGGADVAPATR
jgi:rhodanese-related sulfurtransferase